MKIIKSVVMGVVVFFAVVVGSAAENYVSGVTVYITDMDRAVNFYTKSFGMDISRQYSTKMYDETIVVNPNQKGAALVLIKTKAPSEKVGKLRVVFNVDDAKQVVAKAESMGAIVKRPASEISGTKVIMGLFEDQDGNTIEVLQR